MTPRKIWSDPVWSKVIAAAIIGISVAVVHRYTDWLSVIWRWIINTRAYLVGTTPVHRWSFGLLIFIALIFVLATVGLVLKYGLPEENPYGKLVRATPDWHDYTSDSFLGLKWRWLYQGAEILPNAYCPRCDYQVFPDDVHGLTNHVRFYCDSCARYVAQHDDSWSNMKSKVIRFIQQKIRNGTYQKVEI